jgi:hypothetical protein
MLLLLLWAFLAWASLLQLESLEIGFPRKDDIVDTEQPAWLNTGHLGEELLASRAIHLNLAG